MLETSYTVIGKYERDEMKPSIDVANRAQNALHDPGRFRGKEKTKGHALFRAQKRGIKKTGDGLGFFSGSIRTYIRDAKTRKAHAA
jgi:hypothetical protein